MPPAVPSSLRGGSRRLIEAARRLLSKPPRRQGPRLLSELAPEFAAELVALLSARGEPNLARSIPTLPVVELCRCSDPRCASFYTIPRFAANWRWPQGGWQHARSRRQRRHDQSGYRRRPDRLRRSPRQTATSDNAPSDGRDRIRTRRRQPSPSKRLSDQRASLSVVLNGDGTAETEERQLHALFGADHSTATGSDARSRVTRWPCAAKPGAHRRLRTVAGSPAVSAIG